MTLEHKKRIWLAAAIISAIFLLQSARQVASGEISALPMLGLTFVVFAVASVAAVYYRGRSADHGSRQQEVLSPESNISKR